MQLQDAIQLIDLADIKARHNARWADLGCGSGLFSFALANLLQAGSSIYAIDKLPVKLQQQSNPQKISIETQQLDFTRQALPYNNLTGILMANSLHYVADKPAFVTVMAQHLQEDGSFLIVEYDSNKANQWVPYPIDKKALQVLFTKVGFHSFVALGEINSVYNSGKMYAALIRR